MVVPSLDQALGEEQFQEVTSMRAGREYWTWEVLEAGEVKGELQPLNQLVKTKAKSRLRGRHRLTVQQEHSYCKNPVYNPESQLLLPLEAQDSS